jgi:K+-sensing histidine kinase KdpD
MLSQRELIGEGVIAMVFLLSVAWCAYRWGLGAGMSAALSAALMFDFLFIPPFYTFTIARPEGILSLVIFFVVAIVVVERIQSTLSKARTSEQEAVLMYEFTTLLEGLRYNSQGSTIHSSAFHGRIGFRFHSAEGSPRTLQCAGAARQNHEDQS